MTDRQRSQMEKLLLLYRNELTASEGEMAALVDALVRHLQDRAPTTPKTARRPPLNIGTVISCLESADSEHADKLAEQYPKLRLPELRLFAENIAELKLPIPPYTALQLKTIIYLVTKNKDHYALGDRKIQELRMVIRELSFEKQRNDRMCGR